MPILLSCLLVMVVSAQTSSPPPHTPTEALKRVDELLEKALKEGTTAGYVEEERRLASGFLPSLSAARWEGEELLALGRLYGLAGQHARAEKHLTAYLAAPGASNTKSAREYLLSAYLEQKKYTVALSTAELLLEEPEYDYALVSITQRLIRESRQSKPAEAVALSEKMLPKLFRYAESKIKTPRMVAGQLQFALESGLLYYELERVAQAEAYFASFLKRFAASPLASSAPLKEALDSTLLRLKLRNSPAPPLESIAYVDMARLNVEELKGKVVLLDFFAHWCEPCIRDFPLYSALQEKYGPQGLVVIGVTKYYGYFGSEENVSPAAELNEVKKLRAKLRVKYGFMVGPQKNLDAYGVSGLPTLVLLDRKGSVRLIRTGGGGGKEVEAMIKKLLRKR